MWKTIPSEVFLHHVIPYLSSEELLRIRTVNKYFELLFQQTPTLHQLRMCRLIAQIDQYQYVFDILSDFNQIRSLVKVPGTVSMLLVLFINAVCGNEDVPKGVISYTNRCLIGIIFLICLPFTPLIHFLLKCAALFLQWRIRRFHSLYEANEKKVSRTKLQFTNRE